MDYCTVAELKSSMGIADVADDALLAINISAATEAVDGWCHRTFGLDGAASARIYFPSGLHIFTDDYTSLTDVSVDPAEDDSFTSSITADFIKLPRNAALTGKPFTSLYFRSSGYLTDAAGGVRVTAIWGFPAVPKRVKQATLFQAARFYQRKNAPLGVTFDGGEGTRLGFLDPDIKMLLDPLRKWPVG